MELTPNNVLTITLNYLPFPSGISCGIMDDGYPAITGTAPSIQLDIDKQYGLVWGTTSPANPAKC